MLDGLITMENSSKCELVKEKQLSNGMRLSFFDESKIMAGDRLLVRLCCRALLPLRDDAFAVLAQDDPGLLQYLRKKSNGTLTFTTVRERVFVDEREQPEIFAELLESLESNTLDYLASPRFPEKLLVSRFEEFAREYQVKKELDMLVEEEEDDGPADFSDCFRD